MASCRAGLFVARAYWSHDLGEEMKRTDIIEALRNKKLFGALPEFRDLTTWFAWVVWLKSLYGLPLFVKLNQWQQSQHSEIVLKTALGAL
jgi:hypothetical protein